MSLARAVFSASSLGLALFGVVVAAGAHPLTSAPAALAADLLFWPLDGRETLADPQARFFCGVAGGVCAGWGVMLWRLAREFGDDGVRLARLATAPLLVWFVIDSTASTFAGAPLNVVGNALFLALLLIPLASMRRSDPA